MTLLPHGLTHLTAREQQTTTQPQHYHYNKCKPGYYGINRQLVSPAKRQSKELYSISTPCKRIMSVFSEPSNAQEDELKQMQKSIGFPQGTEQLGVAERRRKDTTNVVWKRNTKLNVQSGSMNSKPLHEIVKQLGNGSQPHKTKNGIDHKCVQLESQVLE